MSARGIRILAYTVLVAAAVCYLFYLNREPAVVHLGPKAEHTYSGPMAMILIATFFLGVFVSAIFAFLVGVRYQLKDWRLSRAERTRAEHRNLLISAREKFAAGRYDSAQELLRKIIDKDPDDIIARAQLAQAYLAEGKAEQARSVLDEARAEKAKNIEVLFLAADIDRALANHTGAMDNLHLVLAKDARNLKALEQLVAEYAALERFDEALLQQQTLVRYAQTNAEQQTRLERLAGLELSAVKKKFSLDNASLRTALDDLLRRHRDFVPALIELARIERENLNFETAAKLFLKSYKLSPRIEYLRELAEMWLALEEPVKALASVRAALSSKDLSDPARTEGQIFLVALLLYLENIEEAAVERAKLRPRPSDEYEVKIIDSIILRRTGGPSEAFDVLVRAALEHPPGPALGILVDSSGSGHPSWIERAREQRRISVQPAPRLLTN